MNETTEDIRKQMQETKSNLSEKLESLEQQVSDTVYSTGTAVNSTMKTFDDAIHSLSNAFDIRRQIHRHPWIVLGGAVVLGYLAVELFEGSKRKRQHVPARNPQPLPAASEAGPENAQPKVESIANAATVSAAYESGQESSSWNHLRDMAIGSLIGVVPEIASRIVPRLMDQLLDNCVGARTDSSENADEQQSSHQPKESMEAVQRLQIASSENARFRKSF